MVLVVVRIRGGGGSSRRGDVIVVNRIGVSYLVNQRTVPAGVGEPVVGERSVHAEEYASWHRNCGIEN